VALTLLSPVNSKLKCYTTPRPEKLSSSPSSILPHNILAIELLGLLPEQYFVRGEESTFVIRGSLESNMKAIALFPGDFALYPG
jgi:hypothetical protein